jgi:flagellar protein FlaG
MSAPSVPQAHLAGTAAAAAMPGKSSSASGESLPAPQVETVDVAAAVERLNELSRSARRNLHFRVDQHSGRTVITVVNAVTAEIVRQIPSEELLAIARTFEELGGLLDATA